MAQWPSKGSNSDLIDLYWEKLPKYAHAEQLNGAAVSATGDYYTVDGKKNLSVYLGVKEKLLL